GVLEGPIFGVGFADDVEVPPRVHGGAATRLIAIAPHQGGEEESAEVCGEDNCHSIAFPATSRLDGAVGQREIRRSSATGAVDIAKGVDGNSFRSVSPIAPDEGAGEQPRAVRRQLGDEDVVRATELALEGPRSGGKRRRARRGADIDVPLSVDGEL